MMTCRICGRRFKGQDDCEVTLSVPGKPPVKWPNDVCAQCITEAAVKRARRKEAP